MTKPAKRSLRPTLRRDPDRHPVDSPGFVPASVFAAATEPEAVPSDAGPAAAPPTRPVLVPSSGRRPTGASTPATPADGPVPADAAAADADVRPDAPVRTEQGRLAESSTRPDGGDVGDAAGGSARGSATVDAPPDPAPVVAPVQPVRGAAGPAAGDVPVDPWAALLPARDDGETLHVKTRKQLLRGPAREVTFYLPPAVLRELNRLKRQARAQGRKAPSFGTLLSHALAFAYPQRTKWLSLVPPDGRRTDAEAFVTVHSSKSKVVLTDELLRVPDAIVAAHDDDATRPSLGSVTLTAAAWGLAHVDEWFDDALDAPILPTPRPASGPVSGTA